MPAVQSLAAQSRHTAVVHAIRSLLSEMRQAMLEGAALPAEARQAPSLARHLQARLEAAFQPSLRRVFNLTSTLLPAKLGSALFPAEAVEAVQAVMTQPCNLEYDLAPGARGDRDTHVEALLCELTGAEAATVVNNNAAAVLLVLATLAARKEVIVSRGELIEIGGSFRIPEIMARAGCRLREVGTTNRTHLADFEQAIGARSALLMKVHASNYAIQGFTAVVPEEELKLYRQPEKLAQRLPTLRLLTRPAADIEALCRRVEPAVGQAVRDAAHVSVVPCHSQIGSGALPVELLPSTALALAPLKRR